MDHEDLHEMRCMSCSTTLLENAKFCHDCGQPVTVKRCTCGNICEQIYKFCPSCGTRTHVTMAELPQEKEVLEQQKIEEKQKGLQMQIQPGALPSQGIASDEQEVRGSGETSQSPSCRTSSMKREVMSEKQPLKEKRTVKRKATSGSAESLFQGHTQEEVGSDWLTQVIPCKQQFFPQIKDELMYFRQGHELYVKAVERRSIFPIDPHKNQPWHMYPNLREHELVRIVQVSYKLLKNSVRLCHLRLSLLDPATLKYTGESFVIKYHDLPEVVNFLVLKQNYDIAMARNWKQGDRFRSIVNNSWRQGVIKSNIPFQKEFPDSMFQCFKIRWDNAECECLSPWDLEPVDDSRAPAEMGGILEVTPQELEALMYKPKSSEWPGKDRTREFNRYVRGLEQVVEHPIAEPFLTPGDLNNSLEYPIDLNTIKRRIENRFYRRLTALQFDLEYIESNARKLNEPNSQTVKSAHILTEALRMYISDEKCTDVYQIINKLSKGCKFKWISDSDASRAELEEPGTSKKKKGQAGTSNPDRKQHVSVSSLEPGWKEDCQQLLNTIMQCEDSKPFREPVNSEEYPDYYKVIKHPMDLGKISTNLKSGRYTEPTQMAADLSRIVSNSKYCNTNIHSPINSMTLRLSEMFESKMKEIIVMWKKDPKYENLLGKSERKYPVSKSSSSPISGHPFSTASRSSRQPPIKRPRRGGQPKT